MAIVNEYKASFPLKNTMWQNDIVYVNATSMEKAVNMLNSQFGEEPTIITKIRDNVLTEITEETTVNFQIKSYYIDSESGDEIEIPNCVAYPNELNNATRGNTVYLSAPNYTFTESIEGYNVEINYIFNKWIYETEEYIDNPHMFIIPLDESVTNVVVKAIYTKQ